MRWLMIGLLVSLAGLLFAAGGLARHVWLHRAQVKDEPLKPADAATETDLEPES